MRFLFLGDMVGKSGLNAVYTRLPSLISDFRLDFIVVNGENASNGFGISEKKYFKTLNAGADVITTGNHAFDKKESLIYLNRAERLLRPFNFPKGTPGKGADIYSAKNGARVLVANVMGQIFMHPTLDDPFEAAEEILAPCLLKEQVDAIIFDFHAEVSSEKQCFAHFLDGRASAVIGTHTHVPTADAQILNGKTAYITDAGMCGDYDSSIGMDKEEPLHRFLNKISRGRYEPASGPATICGLAIEISDSTGLAEKAAPIRLGPRLQETIPDFW